MSSHGVFQEVKVSKEDDSVTRADREVVVSLSKSSDNVSHYVDWNEDDDSDWYEYEDEPPFWCLATPRRKRITLCSTITIVLVSAFLGFFFPRSFQLDQRSVSDQLTRVEVDGVDQLSGSFVKAKMYNPNFVAISISGFCKCFSLCPSDLYLLILCYLNRYGCNPEECA